MQRRATHLDLFSGIGGFAIAAQNCGYETVAFCEKEKYAQQILKERFGAVLADASSEQDNGERGDCKCGRDALGRNQQATWCRNGQADNNCAGRRNPILHDDIFTLSGADYAGVDLLTGGFPCQPFSVAGKRKGAADERALWPEMLRVIDGAKPAWIIGENVGGIVTMELDNILSDLESIGYAAWPLVIPACAVDARHRRDRVWIVAHAEELHGNGSGHDRESSERQVSESGVSGCQERESGLHWLPEPELGRSFNGLSSRLDRNRLTNESHKLIVAYGKTTNQRPDQIMSALRDFTTSQDVQWTAGGCDRISAKEILLAYLCQLEASPIDEAWIQLESEKASKKSVRGVRTGNKSARSSSRSGHSQQCPDEHPDTLQALSSLLARHSQKAWQISRWQDADALPWVDGWEVGLPRVSTGIVNRAHRLRGLGNAIVPQVAYEIIRAIPPHIPGREIALAMGAV